MATTNTTYESLKLENQLCFPLYAAAREIVRKYTPFLREIQLTYTQYIVMLVLWEQKQLTVGELSTALYLDTGTLSPLLKTMEEKGLLTRQHQTADARVVTVTITEAGEALKEKAVSIPAQMGSCIKLTADEAKSLYSILYKLLNSSASTL